MDNLMQNIASGLWIVLGVYCFFGLRKWNKRFSALYDELKKDVVEVRRGYKIDNGGLFYQCSECDGLLPFDCNYCPNCGAKMDGGEQKEVGDNG